MTKHRLMLCRHGRIADHAPDDIGDARGHHHHGYQEAAINTTTDGNITISSGGVDIKAAVRP